MLHKENRYDKEYQKVLQEIRKVSASSEKVEEVLEILLRKIDVVLREKIFIIAKAIAKDTLLDCSEIAEKIFDDFKFGKILEITPKQGRWMKGFENGIIDEWVYHQVYVDGDFVFDPWFSNKPVLFEEYMKEMNKINPNGLKINEVTP